MGCAEDDDVHSQKRAPFSSASCSAHDGVAQFLVSYQNGDDKQIEPD